MGNTNSSGDQETGNAAIDTKQKGEVAGNADGVTEENNIIAESENKDYQEKATALPTNDPLTAKEPHPDNSEDDKPDEDKRETDLKHTFQSSEVQTSANDSVSEVVDVGTQNFDQPMESNLEPKDELHDQPCDQKGETEGSLSHDEVSKSVRVESSKVAAETVEEHYISSSREEQDTPEKGRSGHNEDKDHLINTEIALVDNSVVSDINDQRDHSLVEEIAATSDRSNEETHEIMSAEKQAEDGYSIGGDLDETPKVESSQSGATVSLLADIPQITPSSLFAAVFEPEGNCMVHTPETELISNESENEVEKCDLKKTESSEQAVNEMHIDNAAPSIESLPKETTEEELPANNTNTDIAADYSVEEAKVRSNINVQPDILNYDNAEPVEQYMNFEETFEMVHEFGVLPTKFMGTTTNLAEESSTENGILEKANEGVEKPSKKEDTEQCISHLRSSKPVNDVYIIYAEIMQGCESDEDNKKCNANLNEHKSCEFAVIEDSGVFELKTSEKQIVRIAGIPETENAHNGHTSLEALAFSNEKCVSDKMVPDLESISEKSSNGSELRKSPSFDFGVPFNRRSLESDQTPLLCPEKTPTRSSSVGSNAKFSNSSMRTEYVRGSLDYEAVSVEEKTIRMERSDSDISKTPLLGLFKKGEIGDQNVKSETQQNHVAVMKGEESQASQANETNYLISPGESGKRKPRPSFFSTCICCTAAATH